MKSLSINLLPQKSKNLQVKEEKRDQISVYTALLPLLGVLIWLLMVLVNGLVVNKVKLNWQKSVAQKQARIDTEFLPVRIEHGELVLKTTALAELISKDIKPETLFLLTEQIFPSTEEEIQVVGYGRKEDGSFNLNLKTSDYVKFAEVARRFSEFQGASNTTIAQVVTLANGETEGVINFFINIEYLEDSSARRE